VYRRSNAAEAPYGNSQRIQRFNQAFKEHFGKNPIEVTRSWPGKERSSPTVKVESCSTFPKMPPRRKKASWRRFSAG